MAEVSGIAEFEPADDTYNQSDAVASTIANYSPSMIPRARWETVAEFTRSATTDFNPRRPAEARDVLFGVGRLSDWTTQVAGHPLDRRVVFDPRNIDDFVKRGYPVAESTRRAVVRHYLHRVSAELGYGNEERRRARTKPTGDPLAPYTPLELADFRMTGRTASTPKRKRNWSAALALGAGFGVKTTEMFTLRPEHIAVGNGAPVLTVPKDERQVVCLPEWEGDVLAAISDRPAREPIFNFDGTIPDPSSYLTKFLGQVAVNRNHSFTVDRLRTTWIVRHLSAGTPVQAILRGLGAESTRPVDRCLKYVSPMTAVDHINALQLGAFQ
jgi:hypothetical protein